MFFNHSTLLQMDLIVEIFFFLITIFVIYMIRVQMNIFEEGIPTSNLND